MANNNNKKENNPLAKAMEAGAMLLPLGPAVYFVSRELGAALYVLGVVMFAASLALQPKDEETQQGNSRRRTEVKRLMKLQWVVVFMLAASAALMCMQLWDYDHGSFLFSFSHHNAWLPLLIAAAAVLLLVSFRARRLAKQLCMAAIVALPLLATGCQSSYLVEGTTNIHGMEGQMLYLKVYQDDELHDIDSARVMHGKFQFQGSVDSAVMANLFVGDMSVMPIVIENLPLQLKLNEVAQEIEGSELNDSLCQFIHRKSQIDNLMAELPRKEGRMVMDGMDIDEVAQILNVEYLQLQEQSDRMVIDFIKSNYHNVLGPGIFMILTSSMPVPVMTPGIEEIMATAPESFKQTPYVKEYLKRAEKNSNQLR